MIIDRSFYHFDKLIYSPIAEPQDLASFRAIGDPLGTPLVSFLLMNAWPGDTISPVGGVAGKR